MTTLRTILATLVLTLCASAAQAQTLKSLMWNTTNGQVVANTGANVLTFGSVKFVDAIADSFEAGGGSNYSRITPDGLEFGNPALAATTRTNLGLGLPALTNTSNVTMMRALAGSTNTNQPWSGTIELSDGSQGWSLTFSNGILLSIDPT